MPQKFGEKVVKVLNKVPAGKVVTYGQLAAMAGNPKAARIVVSALYNYKGEKDIPWFRVINSKGKISLKNEGYYIQKKLLQSEGITFSDSDTINLKEFGWQPE